MELVLNTFGTSLSRDNEGFIITHKDGRKRLPVIGIKSIQIGKGVQITSDAVMLAIENEIEIENEKLNSPEVASDYKKAFEITEKIAELNQMLEESYELWEVKS